MRRQIWNLGLLCLLLVQWNCVPEAPHSNPLDPIHKTYSNGIMTINGQVLKKNEPHLPLDSCLILLSPVQQFDTSDANGLFCFTNLYAGDYRLIISGEGFASDTFQLHTDSLDNSQLHFYLNAFPFIQSFRIYSEFIDQWWPDPSYVVNCALTAGDPDGISDLSEIRLSIPEVNIERIFETTLKPDSFSLALTTEDFPNNNVFELIGKAVFIEIIDKSNERIKEGPYHLIRVIETSPDSLTPTGLQSVSARPFFHWKAYSASFSFNYEISVFFISSGIPLLIYSAANIPPTQTQYEYPDSLQSGTYFWTVGVRDELGNFSRSKEAAFLVP